MNTGTCYQGVLIVSDNSELSDSEEEVRQDVAARGAGFSVCESIRKIIDFSLN